MSISDVLMWRYFDLLSFRSNADIAALKRQADEGRNPRDIKVELAQEIVARFHSAAAADEALAEFESRFRQGVLPEDMPEVHLSCGEAGLAIAQLLKQANLTASTSEALRMIDQGAVKIDGQRIDDKGLLINGAASFVVQVGKRKFARVICA